MTRILSIDPSGTGTTGIYYRNGTQEQFKQYTGKEWVEHYRFILSLVRIWQPNFLLFENSNYVSLRGKDMTSLWKLLGAIEVLPYEFPISIQTKTIPVNQVKGLRGKLLKGEKTIKGIEYRAGKGWHYSTKKISTHELDAYLVYWLWESKVNNQLKSKLIGKSIVGNKIEAKTKPKAIEEELPEDIDDLPWEPEDNITFCPGPEPEPTCPECGCYECVCEEEPDEPEEIDEETKDHD